jgi:hypothetical protein
MNSNRTFSDRIGRWLVFVCLAVISLAASALLPPEKQVFWPRVKYDRVIGYQYANPWKLDGLIFNGDLLFDRLPHLKALEKELSKEQAHKLLQITFTRVNGQPGALCYMPHHLFVFYEGQKAVAAIDVCFECDKIKCWPPEDVWKTTSFAELKSLCVELGLGTDAPKNEGNIIDEYRKKFGTESMPKTP